MNLPARFDDLPGAPRPFHLTGKQLLALDLIGSDARHILLYGGSRCVAGDTILDGHTKTIAELAAIGLPVEVVTSHGQQMAEAPFLKGSDYLWKVDTDDGHSVTVTNDHRFWGGAGWLKAQELAVGASVAVRSFLEISVGAEDVQGDTPNQNGYSLARVVSITKTAKQDYYTLHVPGCEHYFANGIMHHNSGKTFMLVRALISRSLLAAGSRHLMARFRLAHINASIVADTWPKVMALCFPGLGGKVKHNKSEHCFTFPNGSEVWYAGLDDKDRTEKILGLEFVSVLLEECSQIPWASRELLMTRLAQLVPVDSTKEPMRLKALYSENPPLKSHWTYKLFIQRLSPDTGRRLVNDALVNSMMLNPTDNRNNVSPEYMQMLDDLGERRRKRFRDGQFGEAGEAALWTVELLEQQQWDVKKDIPVEHMLRIVIGVDPSGASNIDDAHRDEIGIVAAAILNDGTALVLEDATMKGSPAEWGEAVVACAERWDVGSGVTIVGEENYGGAMVRFVVQSAMTTAKRTFRYVAVTATKGKVVRAEPISALYEQGKVKHLAGLTLLEDELCQMTTFGYTGDRSPNRADSLVWALTALFPSVIKAGKEQARSGGTPRVNLGHAKAKAKSRGR